MSCSSNDNSKAEEQKESDQSEWIFDKVDSTKLVFKGRQVFDTRLFNLKYIAQIPVDDKAPFLIFSGVDCSECDANDCIYIHSPSDGELLIGHGQNCYKFPGKEMDYETNSKLLYEGKAYYGEVLNNIKGVIWYQKILLENDSWDNSIFLADVSGKTKIDTFLVENGQLSQTLLLLEKGLCKEIKGEEYTSEP